MGLKPVTTTLTMLTFVVITGILGFRFYLMLFFPGTDHTRALFDFLLPHWGTWGPFSMLLQKPGEMLASLVIPALPGALASWLPSMPASELALYIEKSKPVEELAKFYPGKAEWGSLLSIPIWGIVLPASHWCLWTLVENKETLFKPRAPRAEKPKKEPKTKKQKLNAKEEASYTPLDPVADKKYRERLSNLKAQPAPDIPKILPDPKPVEKTETVWVDSKHNSSDILVRQMLGDLQRENQLLHAQQKQLRSTFSQYFSPNVVQFLEENKTTFEQVENRKSEVSVMFCDIQGFSTYSQSAPSDEVMEFLDEYFNIASHVVLQRFDGVIGKLMGDGLMAYWGFPIPQADHAYIATQAGILIQKEIELRNQTTRHPAKMEVRIGIASGEVMIGNVGSADFKDFTLIGTPVNLASRLEGANRQLNSRLLISNATYAGLQGRIPCQNVGEIEIRGWQGREAVHIPSLD